jgi:hypothetical protein
VAITKEKLSLAFAAWYGIDGIHLQNSVLSIVLKKVKKIQS